MFVRGREKREKRSNKFSRGSFEFGSAFFFFYLTSENGPLASFKVGQCVMKLTIKSVVDVNLFHFKAFPSVSVQ